MSGARRVVFLGPPGSGKGTQAARLAAVLDVPAISTGDMIRAAVESGSELGHRVASIVESGSLVDDATMAELVRNRLAESDTRDGFILDGYPRTLPQADALSEILADLGVDLDAVLMIEVPRAELVRRMLARGRHDDTEEVIRHRLRVYEEQTAPVVERYRREGLLVTAVGDRAIPEVHEAVLGALGVAGSAAKEAQA